MSWLSDWDKRIKLIIDYTKVESILYNFPVLIKLSSESGITNNDVTDVFYELETNDNRKKIAITTDDEVTQCSVEIERWDHINKEAFLWVKITEISDSVDTILYLYYDSSKDNNSTYIGDTGELPAKDVWSSDYSSVSHLSTRYNSVTGASGISEGGSYVTTDIARGVYVYGENSEFIDCGATASGNSYTFETLFKTNDSGKIILRDSSTSPINITVTSGTLDFSINKDSVDKVNNQTMVHTASHTSFGAPANCSDNTYSTYWGSNTITNWNKVDLGVGNINQIYQVKLRGSYNIAGGDRMVDHFKIFGSNDDSNWDELYDGNALKNQNLQTFTFDDVTDLYRYYRFNSYSNHGSGYVELSIISYQKASFYSISKPGIYNDNEYHFLTAIRRGNNNLFLYIDGQTVSGTTDAVDYSNTTDPLILGGIVGDYNTVTFDEVRSTEVVRSNSWVETTYYSNFDNLITFDNPKLWYYYGYITEDEIPVSRTVRLYYRNTGELISATTSNADTGYYYLTTTTNGEHFIVTFDDEAGKDYNSLILDKLLPRGIE